MSSWKPLVEQLIGDRSPGLLAYGVVLTGSAHDAEDLLHDAIVKSFTRGRRFPHLNAAEQYVRLTMRTLAVDRHRSRAAFRRAVERNPPPPESHTPDFDAPVDVAAALRELSPRERVCVVMRFYDDMSVPAIAAQLGLATGTVKRYLSNAYDKLGTTLSLDPDPDNTESVAVTIKEARA